MLVRMLFASVLLRSYCSLVHCGGKDNGKVCIYLEYILGADLDMAPGDGEKKCGTN